jgi:DNA (cytosine-5)-methyltransferase 1
MAGKQEGLSEGSGTRSSLLWECKRVIEAKKPKFLMMENVKALKSRKFLPDFERWLKVLDDLGYNNYWKVINAKHCGIPQNRERVLFIGCRKDQKFISEIPATVTEEEKVSVFELARA